MKQLKLKKKIYDFQEDKEVTDESDRRSENEAEKR